MFRFQINFVDDLNGTEKLSDKPIDGVPLYSSLDILINCLRGNFAKALIIIHYPENQFFDSSEVNPFFLSYNERKGKKKKEDFFWPCSLKEKFMTKGVPTGKQKEITDVQFQTLCDAIKNSSNLNTLSLTLEISLTEYQEQELVAAISENLSIKKVMVVGCISSTTLSAMNSIAQQRPDLNIWSELATTSTNNIRETLQQNDTTKKSLELINMHLVQGFIATLGIAAVATAFVVLQAAALNPLGLILATAGGVALAGSAYSYFSSGSLESPKNIEPSNPGSSI